LTVEATRKATKALQQAAAVLSERKP